MSAARDESQGWQRGRWLVIIALVLGSQVAVIFWLAGRGTPPPPPRQIAPPRVYLPLNSSSGDSVASDPTRFVLPSLQGFSGPAWMQPPALTYDQPKWIDSAPPTNELRVQQLGGGMLGKFLQTNSAVGIELAPKPEPDIPVVVSDDTFAGTTSILTVEGGLATRPLRRPITLGDWPATETTEILSNTAVQTGVNQDGYVFSAVVESSSGSKNADASALSLARAARFEPLRRHGVATPETQAWGRLVFHWHTIPAVPVTNGAVVKP